MKKLRIGKYWRELDDKTLEIKLNVWLSDFTEDYMHNESKEVKIKIDKEYYKQLKLGCIEIELSDLKAQYNDKTLEFIEELYNDDVFLDVLENRDGLIKQLLEDENDELASAINKNFSWQN